MAPVVPVELGMRSVVFTTLDAANIQYHYVNIVTYTAAKNQIRIRGNDNVEKSVPFIDLPGTPYSYSLLEIDPGSYLLYSNNRGINGVFTAFVYGLGSNGNRMESYAYSAGSRIERSIDMLIDGQYIKQKDVCIPNSTTFTPVINHDYDDYHWEFSPVNPSASNISSANYNSIQNYSIAFPDSGRWDVSLIVNYTTPLCGNIITDTVKAIVNMHDTVHVEQGYNDQQQHNICYGEGFYVHYEGRTRYDYVADTTIVQHILGNNTRFQVDKEYIFKDTIPNEWGCDSVIWQHVTIRPTYDKEIYDTVCYQNLPYEWRRKDNGALIKTLTKADLFNKHNLHLTSEKIYKVDSIITSKENLYSQYGCDSLVCLKLLVIPDYQIDDGNEEVCQDSVSGYNWFSRSDSKHKHTDAEGKVLVGHNNVWMINNATNKKEHIMPGQYISLATPGSFTVVDSLKSYNECETCSKAIGCDSVHSITLIIQERKRNILPELKLCDNEFVVALNDTLCVGHKYNGVIPEPWRSANRFIILNSDRVLINHSLTHDDLQCDSVTMQRVRLCQSFERNLPSVSLCQSDTKYDWKREDNGQLIKSISIPYSMHYPVTFDYTDTLIASSDCSCDSILHLSLIVNPIYDTIIKETICDSELPYLWTIHDNYTGQNRTISINRPSSEAQKVWQTTREETLQSAAGCDSVVHLDLTVNPTTYKTISPQICTEELPYQACAEGKKYYAAGIYADTLKNRNQYECDSIININLSVMEEIRDTIHAFRCENGDPYSYTDEPTAIHLQNLTEEKLYYDTLVTANGCKRYLVLDLKVGETYIHNQYDTICDNESFNFHGHIFENLVAQEAPYTFDSTLKSIQGCDSTIHLYLIVHPTYDMQSVDTILCESDEDGSWYPSDKYGVHKVNVPKHNLGQKPFHDTLSYTLHTIHGCDSVVHLNLTVYPTTYGNISPKICTEELPYKADPEGKTYYAEGTYVDTLRNRNQYGCDSILTINLSVMAEIRDTISGFRCENGEPYSYTAEPDATHLQNLTEEKLYYDTLVTANGCKRYLVLDLKVGRTYEHDQFDTICDNESFNFHGHIFENLVAKASPYTFDSTLKTIQGCDSTIHLYLTVHPTYDTQATDAVLCESEDDWSWYPSDKDGVHKVSVTKHDLGQTPYHDTLSYTLHTIHGCDSVVHLNLTVYPTTYGVEDKTICYGQSYSYGTKTASTDGTYRDTLIGGNQYGCDSIITLHLQVRNEIITRIDMFICDNNLPYYHPSANNHLSNLTISETYYDTLQSVTGCDSIIVLNLDIHSHDEIDTTIYICSGSAYEDPNTHELHYKDTTYIDTLTNAALCDSIVTIHVIRCDTFNITLTPDTLCEEDADWSWYLQDIDGSHVVSIPKRDLYQQPLDTALTYTLHTICPARCDSVVNLHRTIKPILRHTINPLICPENLPFKSNPNGKAAYSTGTYNDTLTSILYGCDSILTVNLTVLEKLITPVYVERCDDELPYNHPTENNHLRNLNVTGIYYDTITSHLSGCDSIIELHFQVWQTYEHNQYDTICDNESFNFHGHIFENLVARSTPYPFDTILTSVHGCDSLIHFFLTVYPTYEYLQDTIVCQDTIRSQWTWTDEFGGVHSNINISISKAGDYVYADTLHTIHGCDSVFGIRIHVPPIYRFDSIATICQDERLEWQNRGYAGDKYGWGYERLDGERYDEHIDSIYHHYQLGDTVLSPGVYYDTAHYYTTEGCDSTYYLKLIVNPAGHYIEDAHVCDRDSFYVFTTTEDGFTYRDTIFFSPITRMLDENRKDTLYYERERAIHTANGCDKTMHYHLTVHPTYEYITKAQICWNETYEWRGQTYAKAGVFFDSLQTEHWGCDSVYVLELFKRPIKHSFRSDTICDNDTYVHTDTVWYNEKRFGTIETVVWRPGESRGDSIQMILSTSDGKCDSIIYHYYLKINKTYNFFDTATICSNEQYITERHTYLGYEHEYDVNQYIMPYDTIIKNEYQTINNCDSVYHLKATLYPSYRHIDTISICDDEAADWRTHHYEGKMYGDVIGNGLSAGEHIFQDSFRTKEHGCDSIYELHLMVHPTYRIDTTIVKCENEDLTWRSFNLDHLPVGQHFFYDSLSTTDFGCDSVYHLYLTVNPIVDTTCYDTICYGDSYYYGTKVAYEDGIYRDTITSVRYGCDSIILVYLEVVAPMMPTAWADSICADDDAYDLFYTYQGDYDPIEYTVKYDEEGHLNGFEDIIRKPITTPDELSMLRIPMPNVDEDRTKYPKPNYYNITLTLFNGICKDSVLCSTDTSIVLSYPSWITRQRFGDVIALYNEKYNGGYKWDRYQWYHGDTPLEGETHEYLYIPTGLIVGDQYHVRLTREGELQDFQTCPITIVRDPINNDFAPDMGYLSVTPTCVCPCHPYINILSRKDGAYRISTLDGIFVQEGVFRADVTNVPFPSTDGWYIVRLWSSDTPEEPYRSIKVLVSPICPKESYENIPF